MTQELERKKQKTGYKQPKDWDIVHFKEMFESKWIENLNSERWD